MAAEILHGDCQVILPSIASGSVQLVVSSPPYALGKPYEIGGTYAEWFATQKAVIAECCRVVADGGSVCWQIGNHVVKGEVIPLDIILYPLFVEHGLKLRNRIIWTFGHGLHCTNRFSGRHETILWFTKGDSYDFDVDPIRVPSKYPNKKHFKGPKKGQLSGNPLGKNPGDVWEISNIKHNHPEKTAHPCQFPEELVRRLVLSLTTEGDTVLDPFAGSGTVAAVSERFGRRSISIEREHDYVGIAHMRLNPTPAPRAED